MSLLAGLLESLYLRQVKGMLVPGELEAPSCVVRFSPGLGFWQGPDGLIHNVGAALATDRRVFFAGAGFLPTVDVLDYTDILSTANYQQGHRLYCMNGRSFYFEVPYGCSLVKHIRSRLRRWQ